MDDTFDMTPADVVAALTTKKHDVEVSLRTTRNNKRWKPDERAMEVAKLQQEIKALALAIQCVEIVGNLGRVEALFPKAKQE